MSPSTLTVAERQLTGLGLTDPTSVWFDDPKAYHLTDERTPEKDLAFFFGGLFRFFKLPVAQPRQEPKP